MMGKESDDSIDDDKGVFIPVLILNILIIIIGLYLSFLLIKSKSFHTYPCYNMIIFSLILFFDNILRIIPLTDDNEEKYNNLEYIQAYLLVFFDKLILATLSTHALIFYLGVIKTEFYYNNEKKIFYITLIVNLIICSAISGLYISAKEIHQLSDRYYCYCNDDVKGKKLGDTLFNSIFFIINLFCTINLFFFINKKKKEAEAGLIDDLDYRHNFIRIILLFFLNLITFLESYLIIYDVISGKYVDILYLFTCLLIDLYNTLNKTVYQETLKIFCPKSYEEKFLPLKDLHSTGEIDEDEGEKKKLRRQQTESF